MYKINENFKRLTDNYLFSDISKKIKEYEKNNPDAKVIKLGIGDVVNPLEKTTVKALLNASKEMGKINTFKGYGPERGYDFLINKIIEYDYNQRGIEIMPNEVFVSDGTKSDIGNIGDILNNENVVCITDPIYPAYLDTNIMNGVKNIIYIPCTSDNNFVPKIPNEKADIIYLCMPNNPTGTTLTKEELKMWVDYANENHSLILYDGAYESYIQDKNIPHSIYEIEGAKTVAIEFKSFSKKAGFTGLRCAYTVIPDEVISYMGNGEKVQLNKLWNRRQSTKFNGVPYIVQKAAESIYTKQGQKECQDNINYYMNNAKIILNSLKEIGFTVYGGKNAPYIWVKTPNDLSSWEFFDLLLENANIITTPGSGFGKYGEGYLRISAFNTYENVVEAMKRIKNFRI